MSRDVRVSHLLMSSCYCHLMLMWLVVLWNCSAWQTSIGEPWGWLCDVAGH